MKTLGLSLAAALTLAAASPARAEAPLAILKKVEERLYFPQDHGLKDFSATLALEAQGQALEGVAFKLYWKAPDRKACRLELSEDLRSSPAGGIMEQMIEQQVGGQIATLVGLAVPDRLSGHEADYDYAAEADGPLTKIVGTRKAGVTDRSRAEETVIWVDAAYAPVKMSSTVRGKKSESADLQFEEKGGKRVMTGLSTTEGGKATEIRLEYKQVDKIWLVSSVRLSGEGGGVAMVLRDPAVNAGLDDAVFKPPVKAPPPGGEGTEK